MNNSSPHIEFEDLTNLATGLLPLREAGPAGEHIDSCNACGLQFSRLEKLVGAMRRDASEDAPARAISAALRAFDAYVDVRSPLEEQRPSRIERIKAVLRLDFAGLSPLFGVRSVGVSAEQQILYTAGEIAFDIRITPTNGGEFGLAGQVFNIIALGTIDLINTDGEKLTTTLDDHFYFSFPSVPSGVYTLHLDSATIEIEIPNLGLGL